MEKFKPEAAYFGLESGKRTAFFVFSMEDSHECPEIAEAFFDTGCDIHLSPCMTPDESSERVRDRRVDGTRLICRRD
jgi:hypothetical protein